MKNWFFLIFISTISFGNAQVIDNEDYTRSLTLLRQYDTLMQSLSKKYNLPAAKPISVVAPELIRYNMYQNFIETQSLELLYANYGSEKVDFSIGFFQMKPSFIEKLEAIILETTETKAAFSWIAHYDNTDLKKIRETRLARLKQTEWQFYYAFAYYFVCESRFKQEKWATDTEKINFFATAYNFGFYKDVTYIKNWQMKKAFPYGLKFGEEKQVSYGSVAIHFYEILQ